MTQSRQYKTKVPRELYKDFLRLGVAPGTSLDLCKAAQKQLLKKHHPDFHAGSIFSFRVATEISTSINAAYQRIYFWYRFGTLEETS